MSRRRRSRLVRKNCRKAATTDQDVFCNDSQKRQVSAYMRGDLFANKDPRRSFSARVFVFAVLFFITQYL